MQYHLSIKKKKSKFVTPSIWTPTAFFGSFWNHDQPAEMLLSKKKKTKLQVTEWMNEHIFCEI